MNSEKREVETTVSNEKAFKSKKMVAESKEKLIYLGPSIKDKIMGNTIFSNGISKELKEISKEIPAIKSLIVPINKLSKVRKELQEKDSVISICYQKVTDFLIRKGE